MIKPVMILLMASVLAVMIWSAQATIIKDKDMNLFTGNFGGTIEGVRGSSAPITLNLAQNGSFVAGRAALGQGLEIDTGGFLCPGVVSVPARTFGVMGNVSRDNSQRLEAASSITVSDRLVRAEITADLSEDGKAMNLVMDLKIPWPCRSSTLRSSLRRVS